LPGSSAYIPNPGIGAYIRLISPVTSAGADSPVADRPGAEVRHQEHPARRDDVVGAHRRRVGAAVAADVLLLDEGDEKLPAGPVEALRGDLRDHA
jgi:hypothetical protein